LRPFLPPPPPPPHPDPRGKNEFISRILGVPSSNMWSVIPAGGNPSTLFAENFSPPFVYMPLFSYRNMLFALLFRCFPSFEGIMRQRTSACEQKSARGAVLSRRLSNVPPSPSLFSEAEASLLQKLLHLTTFERSFSPLDRDAFADYLPAMLLETRCM